MRGSMRLAVLVTIATILLWASPPAGAVEQGLPFISFYAPQDYSAGTQNWAITQGDDGVMYFGNDSLVLSFDGARWQQIPVAHGLAVRSLATASDGRILVGSQGEFGYLQTGLDGAQRFQSLLEHLPEDAPEFTDVWQILVRGEDWFFSTSQAMFHFSGDEVSVYRHEGHGAGGSFLFRDRVFSDIAGTGLAELHADGYHALPQASAERSVYALLPLGDQSLLIGTRQSGLYVYDLANATVQALDTASSQYLAEHQIYHGTVLPDGRFAFATLRGGLVLTDPNSDHYQIIDRDRGLPDNRLRHLHVDADGGLWIAMDSGIARLEPQPNITRWDLRTGLDGPALSLARFRGRLHVGTTLGLFRLDQGHFRMLHGIDSEVWSLQTWIRPDGRELLLAATSYGVYLVDNDTIELISEPYLSMDIATVPGQPERLWVSTYDHGLGYLDWIDGNVTRTRFIGVDAPGRRLSVDPDHQIWLETWLDGLFRIDPESAQVTWQFPELGSDQDSTDLTYLMTERLQLIASRNRIWQWFEDGSVVPREDLRDRLVAPLTGSTRLVETEPGLLWSISTDGVTHRLRLAHIDEPGSVHPVDTQLGRLPDVEFYEIYPDRNRQVWVGGSDALYQIDMNHAPIGAGDLNVSWRSIHAGTRRLALEPTDTAEILTPNEDFPLRFRYAAPTFDWPEGTTYRYRLSPTQDEWSGWQFSAEREFTHLPHGQYQFEIQARDAFGRIAATTPFSFTIPPPWYLTPLALGLTAILIVTLVPGLLWLGGRHQARRSAHLEAMVTDRTRQLHEQRSLLETERDKLAFLSNHDELTGLANRRQGNKCLREAWQKARDSGRPMSLALVDVDHFKRINDQFGHDAGDQVLAELATIFNSSLRPEDTVARWGGEEFLLIFPDTGLGDAAAACHRINERVETHGWSRGDRPLSVSLSTGVTAGRGQRSPESLLSRADKLLYQAKRQGRSRVEVERESW